MTCAKLVIVATHLDLFASRRSQNVTKLSADAVCSRCHFRLHHGLPNQGSCFDDGWSSDVGVHYGDHARLRHACPVPWDGLPHVAAPQCRIECHAVKVGCVQRS